MHRASGRLQEGATPTYLLDMLSPLTRWEADAGAKIRTPASCFRAGPWAVGEGGSDLQAGLYSLYSPRSPRCPLAAWAKPPGGPTPGPAPRLLALAQPGAWGLANEMRVDGTKASSRPVHPVLMWGLGPGTPSGDPRALGAEARPCVLHGAKPFPAPCPLPGGPPEAGAALLRAKPSSQWRQERLTLGSLYMVTRLGCHQPPGGLQDGSLPGPVHAGIPERGGWPRMVSASASCGRDRPPRVPKMLSPGSREFS